MPDGFAAFAYDEANTFIWNCDDDRIGTWWTIWRQQEVIDLMFIYILAHLLSILELLCPDLVSRGFISGQHMLYDLSSLHQALC
mgnify:CR=1 FL=1|jgi:hypothetical protein